jgi:transglutaminase-like putative cysteine protease
VVRLLRGLLVPLSVATLTVIATLPLARIYHGQLLTWLLIGAAGAPVLISTALRRLPAYPVAPLSVLALAGYTLFAVRLSATAGQVEGSLAQLWVDAVRNGIPRVLTALIPIEPQPDTVLVPVVATWLAGLAAAELAVRGRRVLLGYAPPTLLYTGALVIVGPNAHPLLWQPLAYVGAAAVGLAVTGRSGTAEVPGLDQAARLNFRLRLGAGGAAALAVLVALAAAVGPALATRVHNVPTDPRRYVAPPSLDAQDENPLIRLSGWALNPTQKLFDTDIATTVPAEQLRIRLAVLSDYDGVNWRVGGDYREAGRVLPPVNGPGAPKPTGTPIRQTITVEDLDGRLLPAAPGAHQVDGVRVAYDQATGTIIRPEGLRTGLSYTVQSRQSSVDVNLLGAADVPSGPSVARFLALGTAAPQMTELAQKIGADVAGAYQRALAVETFLAEHYTLVNDAPSGHAYPNLTFFLFAAKELGGQRGTSEQFAASFAVLARMLGLPSRVVVGFQARPGTSSVRGRDALAWPEVLFTGLGWVPFDPLPKSDATPQPLESNFRPKASPSVPPPSVAPTISISTSPIAPTRSPSAEAVAAAGGPPPWVWEATGGGLGGGLLVALVTIVLLRAAQSRRRLDTGTPAQRVAGAWREVLDALRLAGRPAAAHLPATEVAGYAHRVGTPAHVKGDARVRRSTPPLDELAVLVNQAAFATTGPDEQDAGRAKAQALAYVDELRSRRPWWRRLLWRADPRPLRWR